jgi:hypothetical protein
MSGVVSWWLHQWHDEVERKDETLRTLTEQIAAVRALHSIADEANPTWCHHDGFGWPCPTIRIIGESDSLPS